ncbi:E3 ubiquitin-protein ligase NHLRC1-like [Eucyclogobius newberryi]|uniref:E3 ubiquitin-protein ligase NHLRC1-like n=1 Tax=Eucyclogobius newberryi TaxID=166745 RepID=UPI003B5ABAED
MAEKLDPPSSGHDVDLLKDIQMNLLECKVCFNDFSETCRPQHLLCGHILCQECVSALSHPVLRKLECPFCRQLCSVDRTSSCQVLKDLREMLLSHESRCAAPPQSAEEGLSSERRWRAKPGVWGGWGTLINPVGFDVLGPLGTVVTVHDGERRVVVFSSKGEIVNSFGPRGRAARDISYPLDVAVSPLGHVVVTDGGDQAVKIYTSRGSHLITIKATFQLPWGVDTDGSGDIVVSDALAGSLSQIKVDYCSRVTFECRTSVSDLENPRAVACCATTGNIATIEHLKSDTRLTVFTKDFHVVYQNDSANVGLQFDVCMHVSAVTFDPSGEVIVVDCSHGMVWSLGSPWRGSVPVPLVSANLVRPVAVKCVNNKLMILDSGEHTVKSYNTESGPGSTRVTGAFKDL